MARSTRSRTSDETGPVPLITLETVAMETPAAVAASRMVGISRLSKL